ncbi:MAG: electron transfer flavoprotein-ubiquinone oxidoreductase [Alphaproteobacteria bacterium]|nr:electron transfer flavoprotein-ubiquinone oxidoreductase [Alphaproteobacteria bacterium]
MGNLPTNEVNARQGFVLDTSAREAMEYDVVIVGAGPAGLSAAIRLKQLAAEAAREVSVCVLEKGSEVGAHILSGAVIDPVGINKLFPDWQERGAPLETKVTADKFLVLTPTSAFPLPNIALPPLMKNHGNYIASLGNVSRWLAEQAEALGVEVYAGFAAAEILFDENGAVKGVATGDMGISKSTEKKGAWEAGLELHAKYTLLAEGVRGSLSKAMISHFELDKNSDYQKYGIGIKELWQIDPAKYKAGYVQHTLGYPLDNNTGGGSWMYHFGDNYVSIGFVVHLNYQNPHLSPYDEFQRFKMHPAIRKTLEGGKRVSYGARAITEGGYQSVPDLVFNGGALIGCAAGFVNVPRIKGSHNAMETGMMAAEAAFAALGEGRANDKLAAYQAAYKGSRTQKELAKVRNVKPLLSRFGTVLGTMLGGVDMWMRTLGIGLPFTLGHGKPDYATLKKASECATIDYPKPDNVVSFDKLSSVFLSATNHGEDQPVHLTLKNESVPVEINLRDYDEPAQRYCPAGVYEIVEEDGKPRLQINSQNCVHCKTCDIKDPSQNINWVVPEGGGGPNYPNM